MAGDQDSTPEIGFLTGAIRGIFACLNCLSPIGLLRISTYGGVEKYVLTCLSVEVAIVIAVSVISNFSFLFSLPILFFASLRIADIFQATFNAVLLGRKVASPVRTFILATINLIEFGLCFGFFYALNYPMLADAHRAVTGFYFSFITQLTIGYGDVHPTSWLRIVAVVQGITVGLFVILVFGRIVAWLQQHNEQPKSQ